MTAGGTRAREGMTPLSRCAPLLPAAHGTQVPVRGQLTEVESHGTSHGSPLAASFSQKAVIEQGSSRYDDAPNGGTDANTRQTMADQWTHDRPFLPRLSKKARRRLEPEQPRLELPLPQARPEEAEAQPAVDPERGVSVIDFYV